MKCTALTIKKYYAKQEIKTTSLNNTKTAAKFLNLFKIFLMSQKTCSIPFTVMTLSPKIRGASRQKIYKLHSGGDKRGELIMIGFLKVGWIIKADETTHLL